MPEPKPNPSWHMLSEVDPERRMATCSICGLVAVVYKRHRNTWRCSTRVREQRREQKRKARLRQGRVPRDPASAKPRPANRVRRERERYHYKHWKKGECEVCGFVAEHPCQLDVDHIVPRYLGGSDEPANWQTLCANCHRLKSWRERYGEGAPPQDAAAS